MVSAQALVSWHGNSYSVPPGHGGQKVAVRHQLAATIDVVTAAGTVLARHRRQLDHAGAVTRDEGHVTALEKKVLAARDQEGRPCHRKERRPPSAVRVIRRKANRRHMTGDHHGQLPRKATLQVTATDEILGTHITEVTSAERSVRRPVNAT